jgi:CheY-like chemotaxis protein
MVEQEAQCDPSRLMIADDDPMIRRLFHSIVSGEMPDMTVETYPDGSAAVAGFRQSRHGVLVMDLHMPVMDGLRAFDEIERICRETGLSMPSVIFCTAFAVGNRVREIVKQDKRHCLLRKPVTPNQMMAAIRMRLARLA